MSKEGSPNQSPTASPRQEQQHQPAAVPQTKTPAKDRFAILSKLQLLRAEEPATPEQKQPLKRRNSWHSPATPVDPKSTVNMALLAAHYIDRGYSKNELPDNLRVPLSKQEQKRLTEIYGENLKAQEAAEQAALAETRRTLAEQEQQRQAVEDAKKRAAEYKKLPVELKEITSLEELGTPEKDEPEAPANNNLQQPPSPDKSPYNTLRNRTHSDPATPKEKEISLFLGRSDAWTEGVLPKKQAPAAKRNIFEQIKEGAESLSLPFIKK